jgi:acetone carboxylase gamma subunit
MKENNTGLNKDNFQRLIEGTLPWEEVKKVIRDSDEDTERFTKYIEILQERVAWKDKILLRISDHLYIVLKDDGQRVVKCDCGQELGDYRINWKLSCRIYARRTDEEIAEVITIPETRHNTDLVEIREFYCPECYALLGVEVVPHGYPPTFEMFPDLDTFYRDWLGTPLPDEREDWFQDKTLEKPAQWIKEA